MFTAAQLAEMIFLHRELGHGVCLCSQLLENSDIAVAFAQRELLDENQIPHSSLGHA
jgi:hypothetical protein